jgi:hypothetical protein
MNNFLLRSILATNNVSIEWRTKLGQRITILLVTTFFSRNVMAHVTHYNSINIFKDKLPKGCDKVSSTHWPNFVFRKIGQKHEKKPNHEAIGSSLVPCPMPSIVTINRLVACHPTPFMNFISLSSSILFSILVQILKCNTCCWVETHYGMNT